MYSCPFQWYFGAIIDNNCTFLRFEHIVCTRRVQVIRKVHTAHTNHSLFSFFFDKHIYWIDVWHRFFFVFGGEYSSCCVRLWEPLCRKYIVLELNSIFVFSWVRIMDSVCRRKLTVVFSLLIMKLCCKHVWKRLSELRRCFSRKKRHW